MSEQLPLALLHKQQEEAFSTLNRAQDQGLSQGYFVLVNGLLWQQSVIQ
jgi:hypothetical protein